MKTELLEYICLFCYRIGQLLETLGTLQDQQNEHYGFVQTVGEDQVIPPAEEELIDASDLQSGTAAFRVDHLTYGPPKSSVILCRNLSFQLECGVNILVTGDSGCGKSSLLRVINRLWTSVTGHIDSFLPAEAKSILYLPQKPYFTNGSLREQIMFPLTDENFVPGDDKMYDYLDKVGLKGVVERTGGLDAGQDWNWYNELSPGEMQRLSFVRLYYHKPPFAILDEATCQVNHDMEDTLYTFCAELNIIVLSVGHRSSVRKYHDLELRLDGVGGWSLTPITDDVINP
ncbi:lysosomal cobalamin transporter ABCD4 [Patella vulgata]|uniref:lysosomal cobalamin transporter ABCD4 n=1 Tax=Patella vulgata TaxID=6465 RepID=UPI0024A7F92E|nr:lysosomal cobalamin transporter ABCD4 [Patella vulgata]